MTLQWFWRKWFAFRYDYCWKHTEYRIGTEAGSYCNECNRERREKRDLRRYIIGRRADVPEKDLV